MNAFIQLDADGAIAAAQAAERKLDAGDDVGPMHGVPFALKDIVDHGPRDLQMALGDVYRDGTIGVPPDPEKANTWFALASVQTTVNVTTQNEQVRGLDEA